MTIPVFASESLLVIARGGALCWGLTQAPQCVIRQGFNMSSTETATKHTSRPVPPPWGVTRLAGALGDEVRGINLAKVSAIELESIQQLLLDHRVLFFPGQDLSVEEHMAFGRHFGELESHPHIKNPFTQHSDLFELAATHGGPADEWHTDLTFQAEPSVLSVLKMVRCPATGGDTMWSSLCAAYEEMSAPMRDLCDGLTALHDAHPHNRPDKMAVHPVVRLHRPDGHRGSARARFRLPAGWIGSCTTL